MEVIRLNKFISNSGLCSRREADKLIEDGRVYVNGMKCTSGHQVGPKDLVEVNGRVIKAKTQTEKVYLAFNKPEGITCTTEDSVKGNIVDCINYPEKIFPIGRLDKFSQGLIFMTNDGDIVNKILRAGNEHEKEYVVVVDRPITNEFIRKMANGVPILDTVTKKCKVELLSKNRFKITLTQGLNRQIRRMCEHLGYQVKALQRIRIMNVELGKLKLGNWRHLRPAEIEQIKKMVQNSSKTKEASKDRNKVKKKYQPRSKQSYQSRKKAKPAPQSKKKTKSKKTRKRR
jgi:23S rRNA pseudouridine2604 synthase